MNRYSVYAVIVALAYLFVLAEVEKLDEAVNSQLEQQRAAMAHQ